MVPFMGSVTPATAAAMTGPSDRPGAGAVLAADTLLDLREVETPATSGTTEEPSLPPGNWLQPSQLDGDRWVDPADVGITGEHVVC